MIKDRNKIRFFAAVSTANHIIRSPRPWRAIRNVPHEWRVRMMVATLRHGRLFEDAELD